MYIDRNELIDKNPSMLESKREKQAGRTKQKSWGLFIIVIVVVCLAGIAVFARSLKDGSNTMSQAYETAKSQTMNDLKERFYSLGFARGEENYHVSNVATISIESIKETSQLEVLQVSDIEFVISDETTNDEGITAVLEVPGTGIYTVNLEQAEYVVDKERCYVLVRVPEPELTECKIDYGGVNKLLFKNNMFNDSVKVGEDEARRMLSEAYLLIKKEFASNPRYYSSARDSAENLIINMVKELNPNVDSLIVEVEFYSN